HRRLLLARCFAARAVVLACVGVPALAGRPRRALAPGFGCSFSQRPPPLSGGPPLARSATPGSRARSPPPSVTAASAGHPRVAAGHPRLAVGHPRLAGALTRPLPSASCRPS